MQPTIQEAEVHSCHLSEEFRNVCLDNYEVDPA